jgi:hypothetical protein
MSIVVTQPADLDPLQLDIAGLRDGLALLAKRVEALEQGLPVPPVVVPPPPAVVTAPGAVTDLAVVATTETVATLAFTEVGDGAGQPASYQLRSSVAPLSWGGAMILPLLAGTTLGARRVVVVPTLTPGTRYQFQLVAFRGTLNVDAVFGLLSNVASGTTLAGVGPVVLPPVGGGLLFASEWTNGVLDTWDTYEEFNRPTILLSVAPGFGPGGRNALKVLQRGERAANLRKKAIIPRSQDFYVRFYFRTDDTSGSGDHIATCELYNYRNLTYVRKMGGASDWRHILTLAGCGFTYPIGHWLLRQRLANAAWYRFEYFVHFTTPTAIQVHPRVYDAAGALLYEDGDYQQEDWNASGTLSWGGRDDWTLASYYAAGHDFCVDPGYLTEFGVGNNGQQGAADTGLPWYFAGVEIRSDRWPGP